MEIVLRLGWLKGDSPARRAFRLPGAAGLAEEYLTRISRFCGCRLAGGRLGEERPPGRLWLCDRQAPKSLSSEELSGRLGQVMAGGASRLEVLIGGPDGFTKEETARLRPDLRWSFGPMTLPHELAAVVALEQLYRAWTILRQAPYHLGH